MKRRHDASLEACEAYLEPRVSQGKSKDGTRPERAKKGNPRYSQSNTKYLESKASQCQQEITSQIEHMSKG